MEETSKKYWDKVREFNLSRTPFWISCLFQLVFTILPFIAIWILIGPDFKNNYFNFYWNLFTPQAWYLVLVVVIYLVYAILLTTISWLFHWQKADSFTYSFGLAFVFASIILNGLWMSDWNFSETIVRLLIRFIIALAVGLLGVLIGVIITTFARNSDYKMEEKNYETINSMRKDQALILESEEETLTRKLKFAEKEKLDKKLVKKYDQHQAKQKRVKAAKKTKLDAKENKKRQQKKKKK